MMSAAWTSFIVVVTILIVPSTTITLVPNDPVMFEGDTLKMYCFLDESDTICNFSRNPFKFELNNKMKKIDLKRYVNVSDTVAELSYPNVTVEEFNFSNVVCRLRKSENCTKNGSEHRQRIKVKHLPTIDKRSIRWYNMDQFKFSWTQDNSTEDPYQAFYKSLSDEEYKMCMANQITGPEYGKVKLYTCRISMRVFDGLEDYNLKIIGEDYNLKVIAENRTFSAITVRPSEFIQAAVVNVTFDPDHTKINIRPSIETKMFYYRTVIICNNRVYMNETLEDKHGYRWNEKLKFNLAALPPFTRCNLAVRCRIKSYDEDEMLEIWSDEFSTKFETPQAVPSALPEICSGCFSSTVNSRTNSTSVILYFKRLADSELRGKCKCYLVTYWKLNSSSADSDEQQNISSCDQQTNESKNISCNSTSAALNLEANTSYKVLVEAETEAGRNKTIAIKPVTIQGQSHVIKNITIIRSSEKDGWKYLNIKWLNDQDHNYTIYWCKSSDSIDKCLVQIHWQELNSSAPQPYRLRGDEILTIGISATNVDTGLGSGITWNHCIYEIDSAVPNLIPKITPVTETSVLVKIPDSDSCPAGNHKKYVYGYNINYAACILESCNSTDWKKRRIYKDDNNKIKDTIIIDDLTPSTDYSFFLESLTENEIISHELEIVKRQQPHKLSTTHWILIGFGVATAVILAIFGFATFIKQNVNRAREYLRVAIKPPQVQPTTMRLDSSQPMLHDDQANFTTSGYPRDYPDDVATSERPYFPTSEASVYHQRIQSEPSVGQHTDDYAFAVVRLSDSWKGFREENGEWNVDSTTPNEMDAIITIPSVVPQDKHDRLSCSETSLILPKSCEDKTNAVVRNMEMDSCIVNQNSDHITFYNSGTESTTEVQPMLPIVLNNAEMDAHENDGNILDSLESYGSRPQIRTQLLPPSSDSDGDRTYSEQASPAHAELVFDYSSVTLLNECGFPISLNV